MTQLLTWVGHWLAVNLVLVLSATLLGAVVMALRPEGVHEDAGEPCGCGTGTVMACGCCDAVGCLCEGRTE